jgi:hypothetical protein
LLLVMVFYAAVQSPVHSSPSGTSLKVPLMGLELSGAIVLAVGPAVLSFIVLAIVGKTRAYRQARQKLGLSGQPHWSGEELDAYPNAIDLALYTTPQSPKINASVAHVGYAFFLLLALMEAAWLWWRLIETQAQAWLMFAAIGASLWLPAAFLVASLWCRRIRDLPTLWRTK